MKYLLAALLVVAEDTNAPDVEVILVPKASAEAIVKENLEMQQTMRLQTELINEQQKRIQKLQSSLNCV